MIYSQIREDLKEYLKQNIKIRFNIIFNAVNKAFRRACEIIKNAISAISIIFKLVKKLILIVQTENYFNMCYYDYRIPINYFNYNFIKEVKI